MRRKYQGSKGLRGVLKVAVASQCASSHQCILYLLLGLLSMLQGYHAGLSYFDEGSLLTKLEQ